MSGRNRAFTLMELLVVVAIIALLVGIVIVSMRTVRASAARTESLGALRQMAMACTSYTEDSGGRLIPGYIDTSLFVPPTGEFNELVVRQPSGFVLADADKQSYVWRLAPYVDNAWQTFFADTTDAGAMSRFNADFSAEIYGPSNPSAAFGGISERPSYGMNSIFVGGDSFHGGAIANAHPWQDTLDKVAATRMSEVRNPSRLIVFGPAAQATANSTAPIYDDPGVGYCELRPPYLIKNAAADMWIAPQWGVGRSGLVYATPDLAGGVDSGLPIDRAGKDRMPLAHLDGSTVVEQFSTLSRDMRRWDPFEVGQRATMPAAPPP
jgi:prepilin-type N-terminal cleavage/methylation domain-containing protein